LGSEWGGIDAPGLVNERIDNIQFRNDPHHHINRDDPLSSNAVRSALLATGIVLTSQGVPFLHAGDEFLRTKHGHRNSFNAPDFYNAINWELKLEFYEVFEYYRGLIELRNSVRGLRLDLPGDFLEHRRQRVPAPERVVAHILPVSLFTGITAEEGGYMPGVFIAYNGSPYYQTVNFGNTNPLRVTVNARNAGTTTIDTVPPHTDVVLPPFSMFVAFGDYWVMH